MKTRKARRSIHALPKTLINQLVDMQAALILCVEKHSLEMAGIIAMAADKQAGVDREISSEERQ